jgi:hypothetical protein
MDGLLLEKDKETLCRNPSYQQKRACSHGEHKERAEVVIVWPPV